ncbi:MAG TPA: hypothetical protein VJ770_19260 [Stellaceae bacterium]|nr:hypothetical protein [Stellaceae bacterium]
MATLEFEAGLASFPRLALNRLRTSPPRGARLALISTYDELCGIAAYARALEKQLSRDFAVTVFDLSQYLLRSVDQRVRKFADLHIREICRALSGCDVVNLQLEFGILGRRASDVYRRLSWIIEAAPRLSVTFHSVLRAEPCDRLSLARELLRLDFAKAAGRCARRRRNRLLSSGVAGRLRRAQREKPVAVIVHNRRDAQQMKYVLN